MRNFGVFLDFFPLLCLHYDKGSIMGMGCTDGWGMPMVFYVPGGIFYC